MQYNTLTAKKRAIVIILIVLLLALIPMGAYGLAYRNDFLFLILGVVHLFYAIDFLHSYVTAYHSVSIEGQEAVFTRKSKSVRVSCSAIESFAEKRNGFLEIAVTNGKPIFVHNDNPPGATTDSPERMTNKVRSAIASKAKRDIPVSYRNRY
jgi:hypothetical protein